MKTSSAAQISVMTVTIHDYARMLYDRLESESYTTDELKMTRRRRREGSYTIVSLTGPSTDGDADSARSSCGISSKTKDIDNLAPGLMLSSMSVL